MENTVFPGVSAVSWKEFFFLFTFFFMLNDVSFEFQDTHNAKFLFGRGIIPGTVIFFVD
jgi:hypothetical protein